MDRLQFTMAWLGFQAEGQTAIWAAVALAAYTLTIWAGIVLLLRLGRRRR